MKAEITKLSECFKQLGTISSALFEHILEVSRSILFHRVDGDSYRPKKSRCLRIGPKMVLPRKVRHLVVGDERPRHHVSPVLVIRIPLKRVRKPVRREAPAVRTEPKLELREPPPYPPKGGPKAQVGENLVQSRVKRAKEPEKIE